MARHRAPLPRALARAVEPILDGDALRKEREEVAKAIQEKVVEPLCEKMGIAPEDRPKLVFGDVNDFGNGVTGSADDDASSTFRNMLAGPCTEDDELQMGDIVAVREDGKAYKATVRKVEVDPKGISRHPIPTASKLYTVPTDAAVWDEANIAVADAEFAGAFVRILPPHEASDAQIEAVRLAAQLGGAASIVVAPRAKGAGVVLKDATADRPTVTSSREVVMFMVQTANTRNRPALAALVETLIAKAGL